MDAADERFLLEFQLAGGVWERWPLQSCGDVRFEEVLPVRPFRFEKGLRNFAGWWYFATTSAHVGFESWLERDHLMLMDFDPRVRAVSSLPYQRLLSVDARLEHAAARPVIVLDTIVIDHGSVFVSAAFRSACRHLGVSIQPTHLGSGSEKGHIERYFGSVASLFCQFASGYAGRNPDRRGRHVEDQPLWSMSELQELLDEWLVSVWMNRPHDGLRDPEHPGLAFTPNEKYAALVEAAGYVPVALGPDDYIERLPASWRTGNAEDYAAVMDRWKTAAAATWNRHLSALTSFTAWAGRQEILATNPGRRLERRKPSRRGDRAIPRARLDKLFTDDRHNLRERVLWRMLYETAARAEELMSLNIEDLDLEFRRGRVTSKGGATEYVHWATGTARLLPRLLRGRTSGPVFLADRRAPTSGSRAPAAADICPRPGGAGCPTARRIPVQDRHRRPRPARHRLDPPPAPALRPPAPGRRRAHRARAPGQIPAPAPGQPRPVRPTRRTDLRPSHRRRRPRRPQTAPLTASVRRPASERRTAITPAAPAH